MDMQSMKSGSGKVVSVALAVALGSMGVAPVALASTSNPSGGGVSKHSVKAMEAGSAFTYGSEAYGELSYVVNDDGATVTCMGLAENTETPDNLIVPSTAFDSDGNGYVVTKIAKDDDNWWASGLGGTYTCTIPASVEEITSSGLEGNYNYYFLGACPWNGDADSFSWALNDNSYQPCFYYLNSETDNDTHGNKWKDVSESNSSLSFSIFAAPTKLELDRDTLSLGVNDTETLTATNIFDGDESDALDFHKTTTWTSSNTDVATVDNGTVTAVADGTATITATNAIGASVSCTVTVGSGSAGGGDNPGTTDPGDGDKIDIGSDCQVEGFNKDAEIPLADVVKLKSQIRVWYPGEMTTLEVDKDFTISFADADKRALTGDPASVGDYYLVITGIGDYTGKVEIPFKVIQEAPKINIVEYEDITWEGLKGTDTTIPDQSVGTLVKPELKLYCDYDFSNPLKEGTDYETYFEDSDGKKVTEATNVGTYYFAVEGIGKYEGIKKFSFNVRAASQESGNWKYVANSNDTVTITGYADSFKPGEDTEAYLPAEIDGKAVTGIGTGAFTRRMGALHVPTSVTTVASGAFDSFWCDYVIFEGDCPTGPAANDAIKYDSASPRIPGIFYAEGTKGWTPTDEEGPNWASIHKPSSYDANWVMKYSLNASNCAEWHVAGYKGKGGEVVIPNTAFGTAGVTAIDAGAIADASGITRLIVPANITTIADGAVKGLSADAVVDFQGKVPTGASYANEFQLASGVAADGKVNMTYLPENASTWKGSKWAQSSSYDVHEYDIYTCNPADYIYTLNDDGSYTILGYDGTANVIRVPSQLTGQTVRVFEGSYDKNNKPVYVDKAITGTVTAIGMRAFGSTKAGGDGAFSGKISIPSSIKTIGKQAFMQCELSGINFEEGSQLEHVGAQCFWMSKLPTIEIPASVKTIGEGAFFNRYLTSINVAPESASFASQDGILFSKDMKTLVAYPTSRPATVDKSYTVPNSVKRLENYAFAMPPDAVEANLESIVLNDGLEELGDCVFQNLKWVEKIEIPDSVTKMGVAVFNSADELKEVKLPEGITSIPEATFQFCHQLQKVDMPGSLKSIGTDAFLECDYGLKEFAIPEGVTDIGENAFRLCYALEDVTFPSSLKSIGEGAFETTGLESFDGAKTNVEHIGTGAFAHGRHLRNVTLPDTLKTMGSSVFSSCDTLDSVTISDKMPLAEIPENTFYGCGSLESITIPANIQKVGARSFFSCGGLENVYFLNPGNWELGSRAFWQIDPNDTQNEIPMPQVVAYGYTSSSTPSYVPSDIAKFESLDITMKTPFESGMKATVGKLFELNGLCAGTGQLSYQWYLDNEKVDGATTFQFSFTPKTTGTHLVTLEVASNINPSNPARFTAFVTVNPATNGGGSGSGGTGGGSGSGGSGGGSSSGGAVTPAPGTDTTVKTDVSSAVIPDITGDFTYNGHAVKPSITIVYNGKTLVDGVDYIVSYKNNTKPGTATMIIEGFGEFSGRVEKTFTIDKLEQKLGAKGKTKTLTAAKLKKKSRTVTCITGTSDVEGKLTFKKLSGKKALKVNAKTGKVTVAKGSKKGTYKAQIEVSAAATEVYEEATKIVTVSVRVK